MSLINNSAIKNPGDDSLNSPLSQISAKFRISNSYIIWPYGMGGVAPVDSFGITFSIGSDAGNEATIVSAPHLRPKGLKPGEVYVSNLVTKSIVKFKADGTIEIDSKNKITINAAGEITIDAPVLTINAPIINMIGNVVLTGDLTGSGKFDMGGAGSRRVAREGDSVAGGVITSGSDNSSTT